VNEAGTIERKLKCKDSLTAAQGIWILSLLLLTDFLCKLRAHVMEFSFQVVFLTQQAHYSVLAI